MQDVQLPDNHPWAISDKSDELTDDLVMQRLAVKRGIPRQGLEQDFESEVEAPSGNAEPSMHPRSMRSSRRQSRAFSDD